MLDKNIKLSSLQLLLDSKLGKGQWLDFEVETIMLEIGAEEPLLMDKIYALKALNMNLNQAVSLPEFLFWVTAAANHEHPEFEIMDIPSCLELGWALVEIKTIGAIIGQPFTPSEELKEVVGYILKLEGFSHPLPPFDFVPESLLSPGQTEQDSKLKSAALLGYISHMSKGLPEPKADITSPVQATSGTSFFTRGRLHGDYQTDTDSDFDSDSGD